MQNLGLPGGEREQSFDVRNTQPPPPHVKAHSLQTTPAEYRRHVFADGIPHRPSGLFPPGDALLRTLASDPRLHAFEKHLPGESAPYELLPRGGWATGDACAARGMDLRLFYQARQGPLLGWKLFGVAAWYTHRAQGSNLDTQAALQRLAGIGQPGMPASRGTQPAACMHMPAGCKLGEPP